jgi:membrane associated rhomboid family serine protease
MFERDYTKFLQGEWWCLVTSLVVQDGGLSGSIFNLVSILLMGRVAEELWGSQKWLLLFFGGGILSQIVAFAWQPVGAGNSVQLYSVLPPMPGDLLKLCPSSR